MQVVLLDSAFLIALTMEGDQNHLRAQSTWRQVTEQKYRLVTTTFILDEVATFLNNRGEHELAVETGEQLLTSPTVEMIDVQRPLVDRGWMYFVRHHDKRYSLTDCISFTVMTDRAISEALTFDAHFIQAGFQTLPEFP